MALGICKNCNREKELSMSGKSEGLCHYCYKKLIWKPKSETCPRCERIKPHHARGLCRGCYSSVYQLEQIKGWNARSYHNIEPELYTEITKKCRSCGFDKLVQLHHLDHNKTNNSDDNLVGLCPNCHKMIHTKQFQKEIFDKLRSKGLKIPNKGYKTDGFFKK